MTSRPLADPDGYPYRVPRCAGCRMHRELCVCALIQPIDTRTRVVVLLHQLEEKKPTNTGRLATRCLRNSVLVTRGRAGVAGAPDWLATASNPVVLFPHDDARPLGDWCGQPITLLVPDGTWRQAGKTRKRVPGLRDLPSATLPVGAPSAYRLRQDPRPGHLCTLEAIARALGILEGGDVQQRLEDMLRIVVERTLWSGGRLTADAVTGGVPPAALALAAAGGFVPG